MATIDALPQTPFDRYHFDQDNSEAPAVNLYVASSVDVGLIPHLQQQQHTVAPSMQYSAPYSYAYPPMPLSVVTTVSNGTNPWLIGPASDANPSFGPASVDMPPTPYSGVPDQERNSLGFYSAQPSPAAIPWDQPLSTSRQPVNITHTVPSTSFPILRSSDKEAWHIPSSSLDIEKDDADTEEEDLETVLESKRAQFLARNREAASRCRQKKKFHQADLEVQAREQLAEKLTLEGEIVELRAELLHLKNMCLQHTECRCKKLRNYLERAAVLAKPDPQIYASLVDADHER